MDTLYEIRNEEQRHVCEYYLLAIAVSDLVLILYMPLSSLIKFICEKHSHQYHGVHFFMPATDFQQPELLLSSFMMLPSKKRRWFEFTLSSDYQVI